jgi:hypothetical protein
MKPKKQFRPQDLRTLLSILLIIVAGGGAAVFYLGNTVVGNYAVEVNHRLADAEASGKQVEELQMLKSQLAQSNSLISKADDIFATPENYQSHAITDLERYADAAGLVTTKTVLDADGSRTGRYSVTVQLQQPVSFSRLIGFLNNIEGNIPKMQVSSIKLGPGSNGSNSVRTGDIKIDISVR